MIHASLSKTVIMIGLLICSLASVTVCRNKPDQALLNRRVQGLEVRQRNIHLLLTYLSQGYDVPIGLEVAQGGTSSPEIHLNFRDATLRQVFDAIVAADSRYEWIVDRGVINFRPRVTRDLFLKDLLDTRVSEFRIPGGTNSYDVRVALANLPEIKAKMDGADVTPKISAFTNADSQDLGGFSMTSSDKTLRDILNQIIKHSELKYWILNRDGSHGERLILNF